MGLLCLFAAIGFGQIRRLDGSKIALSEAESFAKQTLADAHVTGAQITVINRGRIVWSAAFGLRRRDPALPMNTETNTWAASFTKSAFAAYVMQLVERGEFNLDRPITQQLGQPLTAFEAYQDSAADLIRDPAWANVTPRMLLSHSSGLANFAFFEPDKKMHLSFPPGSRFRYSGDGINLVQLAVETKKHASIDKLMAAALFEPLHMTRTGMIYRKEWEANVADRYDAQEKFRSQTKRFPARASGNMASSAEDMARFLCGLLNGKVLKARARREMFKPYIQIRSAHEFAIAANEGDSAEAAGVGLAYGMGVGLLTHTKFGPAFFKEGHGDGAQNYFICFERKKSCMVLMTNSDNGELAFRPLLEKILGDTVTPWEWEGYTSSYIETSRRANN